MKNIAVNLIDLGLGIVSRRPALTVMLVYSVAFGAAALIMTFAERRDTTCNPNPQRSDHLYMALIAPDIAVSQPS
jgi:hypothetical protein